MTTNNLNRQRLIECREKLGITKQEAAKRMNLSQPAYLRYESGERTPSLHTMGVIADVLCTSVSYLTGETDDPTPDSYLIKADAEPELFQLINTYKNFNDKQKNRLIAYLKKIGEHN